VLTVQEFNALVDQGFNRIPMIEQAFADLETPLSLYLKLTQTAPGSGDPLGKNSFLLESVVGGERFGRYSFIGLPAKTWIQASGFGDQAKTQVMHLGKVIETYQGNPLTFIAEYQKRFKVALRPGLPRFCGGLAVSGMTVSGILKKNWSTVVQKTRLDAQIYCYCKLKS
jgi:anthranilate synthase component 1